ncbi:hypothetical protein LCGC14_2363840, partial [marine sediment metagenome]
MNKKELIEFEAEIAPKHYNCGQDHYNYKDGRSLGIYHCVDCGREIYWCTWWYGTQRCGSCVKRGRHFSEEHKQHLKVALQPYVFKRGHKTNVGKETWNKGKRYSWSEEAIQRNKNSPYQFKPGLLHPNWKGGVSSINKLIRQSQMYRRWQWLVFKQDGFKCRLCESRDSIEVHHLIRLEKLISQYQIGSLGEAYLTPALWDVNNGETRCYSCH